MRFLLVFACAVVLLVCLSGGARQNPAGNAAAPIKTAAPLPPPPAGVRHVFVVSLDGGKPAVIKESRMPSLTAMVAQGAHTWQAQTTFPSITLTSHTSMLTGVGPEKHKILWNDWLPERGMVTVPTIFALARQAGQTTAMFVGKPKFLHLFVPRTLNEFSLPEYHARSVSEAAARYIVAKKPNLCFIHFADPDEAGHAHGWGSPEQKEAFAASDAALKTVQDALRRAGIEKTSVVIVSADHGGHAKTHGTNSPDDMTIPWIAWGAGVRPGHAITAPITTYDTAATALWLLGVPVPEGLDGKPVTNAFVP